MTKGVTRYEMIYLGRKRPHEGDAEEEYFKVMRHSSVRGSNLVAFIFGRVLAQRFVNSMNHELRYGADMDRNLARQHQSGAVTAHGLTAPVLPRNLRTPEAARDRGNE